MVEGGRGLGAVVVVGLGVVVVGFDTTVLGGLIEGERVAVFLSTSRPTDSTAGSSFDTGRVSTSAGSDAGSGTDSNEGVGASVGAGAGAAGTLITIGASTLCGGGGGGGGVDGTLIIIGASIFCGCCCTGGGGGGGVAGTLMIIGASTLCGVFSSVVAGAGAGIGAAVLSSAIQSPPSPSAGTPANSRYALTALRYSCIFQAIAPSSWARLPPKPEPASAERRASRSVSSDWRC
ncbi:hypothetical protein EDC01DRAFT_638524 [Geopyxis carbonaria]|nr:hypothetical protein EDC01DRAFT_638524 [Geopyxis carbonaria]